jgi:hypothetical protein
MPWTTYVYNLPQATRWWTAQTVQKGVFKLEFVVPAAAVSPKLLRRHHIRASASSSEQPLRRRLRAAQTPPKTCIRSRLSFGIHDTFQSSVNHYEELSRNYPKKEL